MATRIISPEFSFVRLSDNHPAVTDWRTKQIPGAELGFILPVAAFDDVAFQFVAETDTVDEADFLCGLNINELRVMRIPGSSLTGITHAEFIAIEGPIAHSVGGDEIGAGRYRLDATHVLYYIPRLPDLYTDDLDLEPGCGECFQVAVQLYGTVDTAQAVSNVFNFICTNTDFTSVLDYYSEADEAGFYYCVSAAKNRIRLPIYLTRPLFPEEEDSYDLSSGITKIRRAKVRKSYQVVTDAMPVWAIEALRAVWVHDVIYIEDSPTIDQDMPYQGRVSKDGPFDPQWVEYRNYPLANVQFRVNAIGYQLRKNNCRACEDFSDMLLTVDTSAGTPAPSTSYEIDLLPLTEATCCDPTTYLIDHFQGNYIDAISIDSVGTLHYTMKAVLTPSGTENTPFIRVKVQCGSVIKYITITSTLT